MTDKWLSIERLLGALQHAGAAYLQIGDMREAKCYLVQGVKVAQAFRLPRRCVHVTAIRFAEWSTLFILIIRPISSMALASECCIMQPLKFSSMKCFDEQ